MSPRNQRANQCVAYSPHLTTTKALLLTMGAKNSWEPGRHIKVNFLTDVSKHLVKNHNFSLGMA